MPKIIEEKARSLYRTALKDGYDLGTFEEFTSSLKDEKAQQSLYDALSADDYDLGDFDSFQGSLTAPSLKERAIGTPTQRAEIAQRAAESEQEIALPTIGQVAKKVIGDISGMHPISPTDRPLPEVEEAMTTPLIKLASDEPVAPGAVGRGLVQGAARFAEGLTTPENLLLLGGVAKSPKLIQEFADFAFKTMMGLGSAQMAVETGKMIQRGEYGEAAASGVQSLALATMTAGPHVRKKLNEKFGKSRGEVIADNLQRKGIKDTFGELDNALGHGDFRELNVDKGVRAIAIDKQLGALEQVRQSRRGYELLREQLRVREVESGTRTPGKSRIVDAAASERIQAAHDAGVPVDARYLVKSHEVPMRTPDRVLQRAQQEFATRNQGVHNLVLNSLEEAFRGLRELGGGSRVGILPYSDLNYKLAKPHFQAAWENARLAGKSYAQLSKELVERYGDLVVPYLRAFESEPGIMPVRVKLPGDQIAEIPKGSNALPVERKSYLTPADKLDPWAVAREISRMRDESFNNLTAAHVRNRVDKVRRILGGKEKAEFEYGRAIEMLRDDALRIAVPDMKTAIPEAVVKQRKGKGKQLRPPVTVADFYGVKSVMGKLPERRIMIETPLRTVERMGQWAKDNIWRPLNDGEITKTEQHHAEYLGWNKALKDARLTKLKPAWRDRLGRYGHSQRFGGREILIKQGDKPLDWNQLNKGEQAVYQWGESFFKRMFDQVNAARVLSGEEPFPAVKNYIPFMRTLMDLEHSGHSPFSRPLNDIAPWLHPTTPGFKYAKPSKLNPRPLDTNYERLVLDYLEASTNYIHKGPVIAKQRELLKNFKNSRGELELGLKTQDPGLHYWWSKYLDVNAGLPMPIFGKGIENTLQKLNQNLTFSLLSANIHSFLIQPSALRGTFTEIGPKYTGIGISKMVKSWGNPQLREFAFNKLGVRARVFDVHYLEASRGYQGTPGLITAGVAKATGSKALTKAAAKTGEFVHETKQFIGKGALEPLKIMDRETAIASAIGSYEYAKNRLKYSERQAINFAREQVVRTQASATTANLTPLQTQYGQLGRALSLFQTFSLNDWGYLTRDVLGIRKNMPMKERVTKIARFTAATALIKMAYNAIGQDSPYAEPLNAYQEAIDRGESEEQATLRMMLELTQPVPLVSNVAYGSTPFGAVAQNVADLSSAVSGDPFAPPLGFQLAKLGGVPGTQQVLKAVRAQKRTEKAAAKAAKETKTTSRRSRRSRATRK